MSATIRVLLWSPKGAGLHYGGPGTSAFRLYSKSAPSRFDVTLVHGYPPQERYSLFSAQHLIYPMRPARPMDQWRFLRAASRWLRINAARFDVFHGLAGYQITVAPAFASLRLGLPSVVKLASHRADLADKPGWRGWLGAYRRRRRRIVQISGIIAISEAIAQELLEYGVPESKIARIPNGVDTDQFRPASDAEKRDLRRQLGWRDMPTLLFVGGITKRKNPMVLVEACGLLRRRGVECQLAVVGPDHDPPYTAAIKARAAELGVADLVIWHGFTRDVAPLYRASDVYALPSSNEGMPNALLEAMASGLPSVATPISGITDLIRDGVTGRIAEANAEQIAEASAAYLRDETFARGHGEAARERIMARFSAYAVLDAHERLFRRVMTGGPAAE